MLHKWFLSVGSQLLSVSCLQALAVPAQTPAVQVSRLRSLEPVLKLAADPSNQNPAQNIHGFSLVYRNLNSVA